MNSRMAWIAMAVVMGAPPAQDAKPPAYSFSDWPPGEYAVVLTIGEGGEITSITAPDRYVVFPAPMPGDTPDVPETLTEIVANAPDDSHREKLATVFGVVSTMPVKTRDQLMTSTTTLLRATNPPESWMNWWEKVSEATKVATLDELRKVWSRIAEEFAK